jgi:hypothetical protein
MNKTLFFLITFIFLSNNFVSAIQDEVASKLSKYQPEVEIYNDYNFESFEKVPIKLKIVEPIKSETDVYEGQKVKFKVAKDVFYKEKIIFKRGTIFDAKISVIISTGMNGIPASIIFSDFKPENYVEGQFEDSYEISGQDRSWFVFPLKWALTPLPPTGSLTNFIMGGHAKINYKKRITLYYYPEWS